jgi:hypothetical protein
MPADSFSEGFDAGGVDSEGDDREGLFTRDNRRELICDFWSKICISGETGATDRATLDEIEREVTEVMYREKSDLDLAESLTFMALHLISGNI